MKKRKKQSGKLRPLPIHGWTLASLRRGLRQDKGLISWLAIQRIERGRGPVTEKQIAEFAGVIGVSDGQRARPSRD